MCKNIFTSYVGLCWCIIWPSFPFDCFIKIWATCENFWANVHRPPPPLAKNCPYAYVFNSFISILFQYKFSEFFVCKKTKTKPNHDNWECVGDCFNWKWIGGTTKSAILNTRKVNLEVKYLGLQLSGCSSFAEYLNYMTELTVLVLFNFSFIPSSGHW